MSRRDLDPDTPPVGRQPRVMYWTPSKPFGPWYGTIVGYRETELAQADGEQFTVQQVYECRIRGLDPDTVETLTVKRQATDDELYWNKGSELPPVFSFDCPVIGHAPDGRVRVIAPGGKAKLVHADGWNVRPRTRPRMIF